MRWFIAIRYFLSHRRQSLVCIAGVVISVTMFISMTALMNGLSDKFIIEVVDTSGHITIKDEPRETKTLILEKAYPQQNALLGVEGVKPRETVKKIRNARGLLEMLDRMPGIVSASPMVTGNGIATYGTKTMSLQIMGVLPERHLKVTTIGDDVIQGSFDRLRTVGTGILIGRGVADVLGANVDDNISLAGPNGGRMIAKVVGIFQTGITPIDYSRCYMLLNAAQTLLDKKNIVNEISVRTIDYTQAEAYAAQIEGVAGYRTESWQEASANFLKIFKIQNIITYIITAALLVVAAFGVLNILIMSVLERVNDIAIMKSFGLSRQDITVIYLFQGLVIGLIGSSIGLLAGKIAIELLRKVPIPMEGLVKTEGLLMTETPSQYVAAFVSSLLVVMLAAVYPARRAAKYDPVEVIRGAH
jgi:lipoprotein-releasing system permease protein